MIADMHLHYPMRVVTEDPDAQARWLRRLRRRPLIDKARLLLLRTIRRFKSDETPGSGPRVNMELMQKGNVRLAFSVLYVAEAEWDLFHLHGARPQPEYFTQLMGQLKLVEGELKSYPDSEATVVRDAAGLQKALKGNAVAIAHCVEGGFHLGSTERQVKKNVRRLRRAGVAYITLAHLFWRQVATNVCAFPDVKDRDYQRIFCQPKGEGLGSLGRAAVETMAEEGILVDISHMRADAVDETFEVLKDSDMPVIATHAGYRFGTLEYMLDRPTIERIADRNGVVGLIMAQHQLNDGIRDTETSCLDESFDVICQHIDRIRKITGGYDHIAIGSDLDGFIKPTMTGVDNAAELGDLEKKLRDHYRENAERITSTNAIRVLQDAWS